MALPRSRFLLIFLVHILAPICRSPATSLNSTFLFNRFRPSDLNLSDSAILDAMDKRLGTSYVVEEAELVLKLGLLCSQTAPESRPNMRQLTQFLNMDVPLKDLEHQNLGIHNQGMNQLLLQYPSSEQVSSTSASSVSYEKPSSTSGSSDLYMKVSSALGTVTLACDV